MTRRIIAFWSWGERSMNPDASSVACFSVTGAPTLPSMGVVGGLSIASFSVDAVVESRVSSRSEVSTASELGVPLSMAAVGRWRRLALLLFFETELFAPFDAAMLIN